ncbi:Penicillin-insensitive transglycosylase / Transpeptidase-like module [Candidatus Magnetomoraceae bacterium gMMP-15]
MPCRDAWPWVSTCAVFKYGEYIMLKLKKRYNILIFITICIAVFLISDRLFPLLVPQDSENFAITITANDGSVLRSFPDKKGVWRYHIRINQVSPLYLEALINYEDRFFWYHPGINPVSLLRAMRQYLIYKKPMSGGSTLTMQVARIFHPHLKTISGKLKQIFRALQLEFHYTKEEILTFYLNYAPFGGTIEGVQAASFSYLGKSTENLSHAEAALLAVLPQAPSRLRPDRHPERAAQARNKVLKRMADFGLWDIEIIKEAKIEKVISRFKQRRILAPLLSRRLKKKASPFTPVRTTIDLFIQQTVENLIKTFIKETPERTSAAALVVENKSLAVKAYVGSGDFFDNSRFGHVDMIRAYRSPGSLLKPLLYAFTMEEGLIHSESLLVDAPLSFSGYSPGNFTRGFSGPVSASKALQRSLNIPAVDLLDRLGPDFFDSRLRQGGLHLRFPSHEGPNLSMILGGVGSNLEDLVSAYTAYARNGLSGKLHYMLDDPISERYLMSPGAAYIIRQILQENTRPDLPYSRLLLSNRHEVAWKTGTSYGFRDAWTIGLTNTYTVGVWVGRPDGTPSPGQYGRATAAPLMFSIIDSLPHQYEPPVFVPDSVDRIKICWPLGICPVNENDPLCHQRRQAWILNGVIPPTLPDRNDKLWLSNPISIMINPISGLRIDVDCPVQNKKIKTIARWPMPCYPWLNQRFKEASHIPELDPACGKPVSLSPENIKISNIEPDSIFRSPGNQTELPAITLHARGGKGRIYWFLNGELIKESKPGQTRYYKFKHPGRYEITVMDLAGNYDSVEVVVLGINSELHSLKTNSKTLTGP